MKSFLLLVAICHCTLLFAQPYNLQKTNWNDAGYYGNRPVFTRVINILSYGADHTGVLPADSALIRAVNAANGGPGVIFFPAGTYSFRAAVTVDRDSLVFRGAGADSTQLRFDLAGRLSNLITVNGPAPAGDTAFLMTAGSRNASTVTVRNAAVFRAGDWVVLRMDDRGYMSSTWAYGSLSQTLQIQSITGNAITFRSPLRFNYQLANNPYLQKIVPRNHIGFECLKIQRLDVTAGQTSNIAFEGAVNCWVNGIESDTTNFAHIEINHSSNIEVTNSFFHDAFAYGGNGQGYGVLLQFGSNECKITANYFRHLRHSMLLQAGANGNVLSYNYAVKPYWAEPGLPDSSAGDIVLHGNYPFSNLAEGNFVRNIVIDDSHGKNGPFNTFLRNRADGYGIFMNFSPATDSVQFIGNEITNTSVGLNFIQGSGHLLYGNNYRGAVTGGTGIIPDTSLYLAAGQKPPCSAGYPVWPVAGRPGGYNTGTIYARERVAQGQLAACSCVPVRTTGVTAVNVPGDIMIYPNPAHGTVSITGAQKTDQLEICEMTGRLVAFIRQPADNTINITGLPAGLYMVRLLINGQVIVKKLVKE